jgi:dCTP deaminase
MSLLSYEALTILVNGGVITNVEPDQINATSIDLTLGENLLIESVHPDWFHDQNNERRIGHVTLRDRNALYLRPHNLKTDGPYDLLPGEFILAQSEQVFNLPEVISAEYKLKSSMARIGLEHLNAGWCDAGWHGSVLTLELKNMTRYHAIRLHHGDRIGQVVFFSHLAVPADRSYAARGRYNNDTTVMAIKP